MVTRAYGFYDSTRAIILGYGRDTKLLLVEFQRKSCGCGPFEHFQPKSSNSAFLTCAACARPINVDGAVEIIHISV